MTRLAAFDATTDRGSVALLERGADGRVAVIRQESSTTRGAYAEQILQVVERLLDEAAWARTSLDAFAATRGPGSFTGIRVGLGTVRGLALAAARPALGIGTLEALACAVEEVPLERVPLISAGRGEVFGARFDARSVPPVEIVVPWVGPVEMALDSARSHPSIFGPGAVEFLARLRTAGFADELARSVDTVAAAAGKLALHRIVQGARDGEGLAPIYIRPPDTGVHSARPPVA